MLTRIQFGGAPNFVNGACFKGQVDKNLSNAMTRKSFNRYTTGRPRPRASSSACSDACLRTRRSINSLAIGWRPNYSPLVCLARNILRQLAELNENVHGPY